MANDNSGNKVVRRKALMPAPPPVTWRQQTIALLARLLQEREMLWNVSCNTFRNKQQREAAMDEILELLQEEEPEMTMAALLSKIHSLRSAYTREIKKIEDSKTNGTGGPTYKPLLWWFHLFPFWARQIVSRKSDWSQKMTLSNSETDFEPEVTPEVSEKSDRPEATTITSTNLSKKRKSQDADLLSIAVGSLEKIASQKPRAETRPSVQPDEYDAFAQSIAHELRALPNNYAIKWAKFKIQRTLYDAQFIIPPCTQQFITATASTSYATLTPSPTNSPSSYAEAVNYVNAGTESFCKTE